MDSREQNQKQKRGKSMKESTKELIKEGLFLSGTVTGRSKRMVGKDSATELVTYKITSAKRMVYLKDWDPNGKYFAVGEIINVPVSVKPYSSNGQILLDFSIYKHDVVFGEEF